MAKPTRAKKAKARSSTATATPMLTHLDARGQAHMVDVGAKETTARRAVASARVRMDRATFARLEAGDSPKGDVLATARIAGIQAAKRTSELIPLCHAIALTKVTVDVALEGGEAVITATAEARDRTGVEMEALVAASTAALTLYDMLKAVDRGMSFEVALVAKDGGRTGRWTRADAARDMARSATGDPR
jgi:cyclic pyranopterin phosphate synthase